MRRPYQLATVATLALVAPLAFAQSATTSLRGVVKDPSGAVIPGATITLTSNATAQKLTATSNENGEYQLLQLQPATYTITIEAPGFGSQTKQATLLVDQPATVNVALTLQSSNEVVNVSSGTETLNLTDATLGNAENNETIQSLPSETRNVPDLLSLQPGVFFLPQPTDPAMQDSRSGAVNGERSDQSNVTLDGVDDNDQVRGLAFTGVLRSTQDSVQEFRVVTSNANADAGRSSGAQVSLVTKSGTNSFHGAAYEYFRPTNTVSNDFFNKQSQINSGAPNRPPKLIRNIFGADLGGPIKKDKFFFFANYEGTRRAESAVVNRTVPTATFQQGEILYQDAAGNTETLLPGDVAKLDAGCTVCNTAAYPYGPGVNPNALAFMKSMPAATNNNLGDGGYNSGGFTFSSPNPITLNTTIVRLDYIPSDKHRIFGRGNLQKDTTGGVEQFPGQGPSYELVDNSKGFTLGDTWTLTPNLVNDIRYGYVRQGYGNSGIGSGDYVGFRFFDTPTAETRNTVVSVPVNNIIDNLNWTKGKHSLEFGGNWRLIDQNRTSDANSYNSASTNPYWLSGTAPDPSALIGKGAVNGGFQNSYDIAYASLVGDVPSVTNVSNYEVTSPTSGKLLPDGAPIARHFRANEFEYYAQDQWRIRPNLTLTFGLRHTILQTPYETHGQEVAPTIDTHSWFIQRETAAQQGQIYEPDLQFAPAGKAYGKPGFWPKSKNNIAPRVALVYAPDAKTSIRMGAGIYYDHYGQALVNTFDQNGSFGLSTSVTNQAGRNTTENSPRFTNRHTLPFSNGSGAPTQAFPYTAPTGNFAITWGLDSKLKTPYTEALDLSVQRELGHGWTVETAYVGRMGRHLLQQLDLSEPVDFVDPQGGGDYYTAGTQISKISDMNGDNPKAIVPAIKYFEDLFPYMANYDYMGESATQAIYTNEWAPSRATYGATTALADIDFYCAEGCPAGHQSRFWQDQFSSLYALSTIGMSYYNGGQITLRHASSHGFQGEVSYTYSRSIDFGSDAERTSEFSNGVAFAFSEILNTWNPALNRAVSDFDTTHLVTGDWVYQLPLGHGQKYLGSSGMLTNALLGGWQWSGIFRASSGLPFSVFEPGWTTDWQQESFGVTTRKVSTQRHFAAGMTPTYFKDPSAINSGVYTANGPIRLPYPGEAGERNNFRGDGYLNLDSGLTKGWQFSRYGAAKFAWEVYNVTNTVRFDPASISNQLTSGSLGIASAELTQARRMQFSLRYDF